MRWLICHHTGGTAPGLEVVRARAALSPRASFLSFSLFLKKWPALWPTVGRLSAGVPPGGRENFSRVLPSQSACCCRRRGSSLAETTLEFRSQPVSGANRHHQFPRHLAAGRRLARCLINAPAMAAFLAPSAILGRPTCCPAALRAFSLSLVRSEINDRSKSATAIMMCIWSRPAGFS